MQCSQQLAKMSTSFTVCDDKQVSKITMCSATFTALCPEVLREFSKKKNTVFKLLQQNTLHFYPLPLCLPSISWQDKKQLSGSLKKKNLAKRPPFSISVPLLGNLYKELILEPVKTWRPKVGGALRNAARGGPLQFPEIKLENLAGFSWFSTAHIWGSNRCFLVETSGLVDIFCALLRLGNFTRYFSSRVFFYVICLSCDYAYLIVQRRPGCPVLFVGVTR